MTIYSESMTDKTHQLIGLTATSAAFLILHPNAQVTWPIAGTILIGSFLGSVAPDIDQPTCNLWDSIPLGGFLGKLTSKALGGHRNLSHSILGVILFGLLFYWLASLIPSNWFLVPDIAFKSAVIGFIAHLAADSVTVMGIPLFWPFGGYMGFPPHPFQGIRIITGKWFENLVVFPGIIVVFLVLLATHTTQLCPILFFLCNTS